MTTFRRDVTIIASPDIAKHQAMMRELVHAAFMNGMINRDGVAALCDAAFDELLWIDENFKHDD